MKVMVRIYKQHLVTDGNTNFVIYTNLYLSHDDVIHCMQPWEQSINKSKCPSFVYNNFLVNTKGLPNSFLLTLILPGHMQQERYCTTCIGITKYEGKVKQKIMEFSG